MKAAHRLFLLVVGAALALEAGGLDADPMERLGIRFQSDMSAWTPFHIIVSVFELLVATIAIIWLCQGQLVKKKWRYLPGTLTVPMMAFAGTLVLGTINGVVLGNANMTEALWEVRGFGMLVIIYLMTGIFVRNEGHLDQVVWTVLIASAILATDNTLRWLIFLRTTTDDLGYDHSDSVVLVVAVLVCLGLFAFGGTRNQQRFAAYILPLLLFSMLVMRRRAAFVILAVGLIVFAVFLLRLRPRVFWKIVPILTILIGIYLVIFWKNTGTLGQPARAISSQFSPDPRDASSNLYRDIEKADIIANIQLSPLTGLGFGQPYHFFFLLPDLSGVWPFFHFLTHNAILWIWMKGGALCFIAFWWLLGRGAFDGSRVVETQREEWHLAAQLTRFLRRFRNGKVPPEHIGQVFNQYAGFILRPSASSTRGRLSRQRSYRLNVATWLRSDERSSVTARRSGAMALFVAAVCLIPIQVVYSYVDEGLGERNMLLLGLMLGILARGHILLGLERVGRPIGRKRTEKGALARSTQTFTTQDVQDIARDFGVLSHPLGADVEAPAIHKTPPTRATESRVSSHNRSPLVLQPTLDQVPLPWEASPEQPQ